MLLLWKLKMGSDLGSSVRLTQSCDAQVARTVDSNFHVSSVRAAVRV